MREKRFWQQEAFYVKKKTLVVTAVTGLLALTLTLFVGNGFRTRTDVALSGYALSEDGMNMTLHVRVMSSMGYVRSFRDDGGGVKPHYLTFYATFGGLNSSLGAKDEFVLALDKRDTEIYFNRPGGGYELVLQKDGETDQWQRP